MHPKTLFHLVPTNQVAREALLHPDNKKFVSSSSLNHGPGLEVGYHVTSLPRGHVIARLGRNADLILRESSAKLPMSTIHVAFEINPATHLVLLSVRSKRISSVSFSIFVPPNENGESKEDIHREMITGDGVIMYMHNYCISIASYTFTLVWRTITLDPVENGDLLKAFTVQGYKESEERREQMLTSRDRPTGGDISEAQSWHVTRLNSARPVFQDVRELREEIGEGSYGKVYQAIDQASGHAFAIKVVSLGATGNLDAERAMLHREIKVMERLKHENIIELLGHQFFHTLNPEIHMPLRAGSLKSLVPLLKSKDELEKICLLFVEQILCALDYLASENLIHRDVKPDNILYSRLTGGSYLFQLADFGLTHYQALAKTICGTLYYSAPELWPQLSGIHAGQSPKMDVWSLCATIVAVHSRFTEFPPPTTDLGVVMNLLRARAATSVLLKPMARLQPERRASAAQLLVLQFGGRGLTTKRSEVTPIESDAEYIPQENLSQEARPTGSDRNKAPAGPLIVSSRRRPFSPKQGDIPAPNQAHNNRVVKPWAEQYAAPARPLDQRSPPKRTRPATPLSVSMLYDTGDIVD